MRLFIEQAAYVLWSRRKIITTGRYSGGGFGSRQIGMGGDDEYVYVTWPDRVSHTSAARWRRRWPLVDGRATVRFRLKHITAKQLQSSSVYATKNVQRRTEDQKVCCA